MKRLILILLICLLPTLAFGADSEVQDLTDITSPAVGDDLYIVDDPDGTPISRKISIGALLDVMSGDVTSSAGVTTVGSDADWTAHDSYPTGCTNQFVTTIADTLTCASVEPADVASGVYDFGTSVEGDTLTEGGVAIINATQGGTWTGDHNFGGSTMSFEIPNDAAVNDPNVAGEIAIDTTDDQFLYYGAAQRVLHYEYTNCMALADATDVGTANNYKLLIAPAAITVTAVSVGADGTSCTVNFQDDADNAIEDAKACDVASPYAWDEAIAGTATIAEGESIEVDVTATGGDVTGLIACVRWTRDAN